MEYSRHVCRRHSPYPSRPSAAVHRATYTCLALCLDSMTRTPIPESAATTRAIHPPAYMPQPPVYVGDVQEYRVHPLLLHLVLLLLLLLLLRDGHFSSSCSCCCCHWCSRSTYVFHLRVNSRSAHSVVSAHLHVMYADSFFVSSPPLGVCIILSLPYACLLSHLSRCTSPPRRSDGR